MLEAFAVQLSRLERHDLMVLELGSGPGFLAELLLRRLPTLRMSLLDFSLPMHELARDRLGIMANRVTFVHCNFKTPTWPLDLGKFDAVVTNQAVHELRHKRHAKALHQQVRSLLTPAGTYIVCDHFHGDGGMGNDQLYMSIEEQRQALMDAGFESVELVQRTGTLVMHLSGTGHR